MNPDKKTLIPYINNASNKDSLKLSEKSYKFKNPTATGTELHLMYLSLRMSFRPTVELFVDSVNRELN